MIKKLLVAASCALMLAASLAQAQPSGSVQSIAPLTRDLGALQKLSAQGAATVNSADQSGFNMQAIVCVFRQSTVSGSPSSTFAIQGKDAASGQYYTILTSASFTTSTAANPIAIGLGLPNVSNSSQGFPIPRTWRTSVTVGGSSTPTSTSTVGCSVQ